MLEIDQKTFEFYRDIRRKIHQNPETAFEEFQTAQLIGECLNRLSIPFESGICTTGIVAHIDSGRPGKCLVLRADMDALPVQEQNSCSYASKVKGKMHACGHDVHVATLLLAADLLARQKSSFCGSVKLIFQPAEETTGGAQPMIDAGVLEEPKVDFAAGFHVNPDLAAGSILAAQGPIMASPDNFYMTLTGKGGHCATPYKNDDLIQAGTQIVSMLSSLCDKFVNPLHPSLITVCTFQTEGESSNVMPSKLHLSGSFRTFDQQTREFLGKQILECGKQGAKFYHVECDTRIEYLYPPLVNHPELTQKMQQSALKILPEDHVLTEFEPAMIGEDFSYFGSYVPSTYFYLGAKIPGHETALHAPNFDVDETCMKTGAAVLAQFAMDLLK